MADSLTLVHTHSATHTLSDTELHPHTHMHAVTHSHPSGPSGRAQMGSNVRTLVHIVKACDLKHLPTPPLQL